MSNEKRNELKKELNETLKNVASSDVSEAELQGGAIRGVFFTMMAQDFSPEEIMEVFEGVEISDEKMALIEENDRGFKR